MVHVQRAFVAGVFLATLALPQSGGQEKKKLLPAKGWGSLSGKVVNPRVKQPVADVVVFLKPPAGTYFPIHKDDKIRKAHHVIEMGAAAFKPRVSGHFPVYFDGAKFVATGEKITFKNTAQVTHCVRLNAHPILNDGNSFNVNMTSGTSVTKSLKPQPNPVAFQCDIVRNMTGLMFVFDHHYFAITNKDGTFTIPRVPAGAQVSFVAWDEKAGWVMGRNGTGLKFMAGKNTFDFVVQK